VRKATSPERSVPPRREQQYEEVDGRCRVLREVNATVAIVNGPDVPGEVTDFVFWDNDTVDADGKVQRVNATITIEWAPILLASVDAPTQIDYDGYETWRIRRREVVLVLH
jgi:hypothetical protein